MSEVWNHFKLAANGLSVTCYHCGKFMKRSDSSTKSMWGHLNSFHKEAVGEETFQMKRKRRIYPKDPNAPPPRKRNPRKKLGEVIAGNSQKLTGTSSSSIGEEEDEQEACSSSNATTRVSNSPQMTPFGGSQDAMVAAAHLQHMLAGYPELLMMFNPMMAGGLLVGASVLPPAKVFGGCGMEKEFVSCSPAIATPLAAIGGGVQVKQEIQEKTPTQPYVKRKRSRASPGDTNVDQLSKAAKLLCDSNPSTILDIKPKDEISEPKNNPTNPSFLPTPNGYNSSAPTFLLNSAGAFDPILGDTNLLSTLDPATLMAFMGELLKESEKFNNNHPAASQPGLQSTICHEQKATVNFAEIASLANISQSKNYSTTLTATPKNIYSCEEQSSNNHKSSNKLAASKETKKLIEQKALVERNYGAEMHDADDTHNRLSLFTEKPSKLIKTVEDEGKNPPKFNIAEPVGLYALHQIAMDLQLTYSSHGRRGIPEYCFESNKTAERSGARGRMITLTENDQEVQICEKVNGYTTVSETWTKKDLPQLVWAIRGKCQKSLCK